ncbi:hypothetical protein PIB30_025887 [Stylosanthes scabra]|uniref:Uncharacterized protein n=1 Tax=Stylosanthes scabra TaxID=79078 RepID=A0ABU6Y7E0_9FABA|nr:hypothetical protein [Stylosanthes scabra]
MARDGGRGRGAATRGRGRPRKNTGIPLNLDPKPHPATSTPTTTMTIATHTTTPPIVATSGPSAGLPHMSSETGGPGPVQQSPHVPETQTSSQPLPTPDTDVADEDAEAVASAIADTRPLLIWDGHDWNHGDHQRVQGALQVKRFRFPRGDEANMRKAWESKVAKRHRGLMHNIQEKGAPHDWIPDDIFARYEAFWRSPEYQAMRRANKTNRASSTGGSLHTGGSITYPATAKKMAIELGRPPTQSEVFVRTHTKKKDQGQYVDARFEQFVRQSRLRLSALRTTVTPVLLQDSHRVLP